MQAGRVDEHELAAGPGEHATHAGARGLRLVADDAHLAAAQRVDEGALAHVGAADDRDEPAAQVALLLAQHPIAEHVVLVLVLGLVGLVVLVVLVEVVEFEFEFVVEFEFEFVVDGLGVRVGSGGFVGRHEGIDAIRPVDQPPTEVPGATSVAGGTAIVVVVLVVVCGAPASRPR